MELRCSVLPLRGMRMKKFFVNFFRYVFHLLSRSGVSLSLALLDALQCWYVEPHCSARAELMLVFFGEESLAGHVVQYATINDDDCGVF
jgi:hypothetical protein